MTLATLAQTGQSIIQQGVGVLAVYFRLADHLTLAQMGTLFSALSFGMMLAMTIAGRLVDRFGPGGQWFPDTGALTHELLRALSAEKTADTVRLLVKGSRVNRLERVVSALVGDAFDPDLHEAMATQPSTEVAPDHILQVVQRGYRLHDRLLRPARVIVARAPDAAPASDA